MNNMDWQTLRNTIIRETSDFPGGHLEDELITRYSENPQAVEQAVEKILAGYRAGKVRSVWGALKAEIARAFDPANNPKHDRSNSRKHAIEHAEQWLKNAGLHFDRQTEIHDELFGERGLLAAHADPKTKQHLAERWQELRPLGEQTEREANERGARYIQQRQAMTEARKPVGNLEPKPAA